MELVDQQDAQKIPDFSGATGWEGELAFQVGWRQGGQDGQRFFPHCRGIALQRGNSGVQRHHLLEGMAGPKVLRLGRHMKLLIPCASDPGLGPAADVGENGVFDAGLVPEEPADGVALLAGALQEVGIGEPLEGWGHKSVRIEGQGIRHNSLQIHTHTPLLAIVALTFYASLILWLVPETACTWHWAGRIARVQNRLNYLGGNGRGPHGGVHCRAKGGRAYEPTGIRIHRTTLWSPAAAVADGTQDEPVRPCSGGRYLGPSSQFPRNRARPAEPRHGPPPGHQPRCPLARAQPLAAGGRLCPDVS